MKVDQLGRKVQLPSSGGGLGKYLDDKVERNSDHCPNLSTQKLCNASRLSRNLGDGNYNRMYVSMVYRQQTVSTL